MQLYEITHPRQVSSNHIIVNQGMDDISDDVPVEEERQNGKNLHADIEYVYNAYSSSWRLAKAAKTCGCHCVSFSRLTRIVVEVSARRS